VVQATFNSISVQSYLFAVFFLKLCLELIFSSKSLKKYILYSRQLFVIKRETKKNKQILFDGLLGTVVSRETAWSTRVLALLAPRA
jgi:hypothetical protein